MKLKKAAPYLDGSFQEFLRNLGTLAKQCLLDFWIMTSCWRATSSTIKKNAKYSLSSNQENRPVLEGLVAVGSRSWHWPYIRRILKLCANTMSMQCCLKSNHQKSEVSVFYHTNKLAHRELNVTFGGEKVRRNPYFTYLGITVDRPSTYKQHLTKVTQKIKWKNNILRKLSGTSWGTKGDMLRTPMQALTCFVGEYSAPVCYKSTYTNEMDAELKKAMSVITGTLRSTSTTYVACDSCQCSGASTS